MYFYYLPADLKFALQNININNLREIRLRNGQPVIIMYGSEYKYINKFGATGEIRGAIRCNNADEVLRSAMQKSVYAFSEQLKSGFITVDGGVRIGICGEYVTQDGHTVTVKNVTSLNLRIPHDVAGVADEVFEKVCADCIKSELNFSQPGYGK
ncbi:MAG: hypothetical protein K2N14_05175, partial [Clostridia bacterium]|nr:hypothetical protein [Clostridia bacterium]